MAADRREQNGADLTPNQNRILPELLPRNARGIGAEPDEREGEAERRERIEDRVKARVGPVHGRAEAAAVEGDQRFDKAHPGMEKRTPALMNMGRPH
jgi:hypothetical protein